MMNTLGKIAPVGQSLIQLLLLHPYLDTPRLLLDLLLKYQRSLPINAIPPGTKVNGKSSSMP